MADTLGWLILIALVGSVLAAYVLAWRSGKLSVRRIGAGVVALLSALAGYVGTVWYAIPSLHDFHNPAVPLSTAILGNLLLWAICAAAWTVAARFVRLALRGS